MARRLRGITAAGKILVVSFLCLSTLTEARRRSAYPNSAPGVLLDTKEEDNERCDFGQPWENLLGGCYIITKTPHSWSETTKSCKNLDPQSDFGTLWTARDTEFVANLAKKNKVTSLFVNGKYIPALNEFRWQYNRPFVEEDTPWTAGEPKQAKPSSVLVFNVNGKGKGTVSTDVSTGVHRLALCKRPAIGFRRRTAEEIEDHSTDLSDEPYAWKLPGSKKIQAKKIRPRAQSTGNQSLTTKKNNSKTVSTTKKGAGIAAKGPAPAKGTAPANPDGPQTGARSGQGSGQPVQATTKFVPSVVRNQPSPISKDRQFREDPSRFLPVMPHPPMKAGSQKSLEVSAVMPVDVIDLVKAREDKMNELFRRSALRLKELMKLYPEDFRYPATDYERMAHVLTTELIAQDQRERKVNAPYESAKTVLSEMFDKGRAIQCYFGDSPDNTNNREVECIAEAGVIDACVKQTLLTGKIIRGCNLPGNLHDLGKHTCLKTTSGEICTCREDLCNTAAPPKYFLLRCFFSLVALYSFRVR